MCVDVWVYVQSGVLVCSAGSSRKVSGLKIHQSPDVEHLLQGVELWGSLVLASK